MKIRAETVADYAEIAKLNIRAFHNRMGEANLVALLRQRSSFDPDLALVAEQDNRIIGYALFNPVEVILYGEIIKATNLAPLAVLPEYQGQGIGAALVKEGLKRARDKGYDFDMLLGHSDYYPRFGYQTESFGSSSLTVSTSNLETLDLETSPPQVTQREHQQLVEILRDNHENINFTLAADDAHLMWLSADKNMPCTVYRHQAEIVGYTRGTKNDVRLFIARDDAMARAIAKQLAEDAAEITLPLHPHSSIVSAFPEKPITEAWKAAMICPLQEDAQILRYLSELKAGASIGHVLWSSLFDIA